MYITLLDKIGIFFFFYKYLWHIFLSTFHFAFTRNVLILPSNLNLKKSGIISFSFTDYLKDIIIYVSVEFSQKLKVFWSWRHSNINVKVVYWSSLILDISLFHVLILDCINFNKNKILCMQMYLRYQFHVQHFTQQLF